MSRPAGCTGSQNPPRGSGAASVQARTTPWEEEARVREMIAHLRVPPLVFPMELPPRATIMKPRLVWAPPMRGTVACPNLRPAEKRIAASSTPIGGSINVEFENQR